MTDQPATQATEPDDVDRHVCKPGASIYYCPTGGETESDCHGGFDVCCARPDLHQPLVLCSTATLRLHPHGPHSWEPQPGMDPVHCLGHDGPDHLTLEDLDAAPEPSRWCCSGNAEDCPLCDTAALPYPWICPGHPDTEANRQLMTDSRAVVEKLTDAHQATIGELRRAEARVRDLEAALVRVVAALPPYSGPILGDRSRGMQMGWDRARQAALDAIDGEPVRETAVEPLHRYREWLAAQHAKAVRADRVGGVPDHLKISPHNGIAAGLGTALHGLDRILGRRDGGPLEKAGD
ncbi:hypothetical protein JL475_00240 [Streptomyces sp. M2CJ-2]|uniref:hypothetical protein n=1 Tax=Streptomyces sp. M2CJ-2 TaxID=2803948 RepID=UPI0019245AAC|nr:hypothetical protein [Streptomyces sp. M2CJ-2]MBL3664474.1 hypothetical protein [Streptomyces sp. M2CJ-2]